jgi:hypothetical protein
MMKNMKYKKGKRGKYVENIITLLLEGRIKLTLNDEDWQDHWEKLFEKLDAEGYESLTSDERIWFNVRGIIDTIDNGGIISFYYNHGADTLDDTIDDLRSIDAVEIIDLLQKVNKLFPNDKPSKDIDERNEVINSWDDGEHEDLFEALDDQFYNELSEVVEAKLETVIKRIIQVGAT